MATDFTLKVGDTAPSFDAILKDADGATVDLTGATVKLFMTNKSTNERKVNATVNITDALNGGISYPWEAGDTDTAGTYSAEFEVTFNDGTIETFPNSKYLNVKIVLDLGGDA